MSDGSISQSLPMTVPQTHIGRGKRNDGFAGSMALAWPEATGKAWTVGPDPAIACPRVALPHT